MVGGGDNDLYYVNHAGDRIVELAGGGNDTVRVWLTTFSLAPFAQVETLIDQDSIASALTGNDLGNRIIGNAGNDTLVGVGGADTLSGGAGNDSLYGGDAIDRMSGGAGDDAYLIDSVGDIVTEVAGQGIDTLRTTLASQNLAALVEHLVGLNDAGQALVGNILGNSIIGAAGADTITGGGGNDTIDGGAGADRASGGLGDDLFIATTGDVFIEAFGQGFDTVQATTGTAWTLAANLDVLVLAGPTLLTGVGNAIANRLTGNDAANVLYGFGGADSLEGAGGKDVLVGGAGVDTLTGGADADQFRIGIAADTAPGQRDVVLDFTFDAANGFDKVDLRFIDTDPAAPLGQGFAYIGAAAFGATGTAQLRVTALAPGVQLAEGDVDDNGTADLAVEIHSAAAPVAGWFLL